MQLRKGHRIYLVLVVFGYFVLAVNYALATPPLEASDEYKHYPVVQYIENEAALPKLVAEDPGLWLQSAVQPPLYYMIMAALSAGIDTSDLVEIHEINPHAFVGNPNQVYNKNLIIHQPEREQFPWRGSVLAIYMSRLFTILFGAVTIVLVAHLGSLLFNTQVAILAAALTAFNPMFIFVNSSVNNDGLAILLGTLGLLLIVKLWHEEPAPGRFWFRYVLTGLVIGLAVLTKLSLAGLLLLIGLALAVMTWRKKDWKYLFFGGSIILLTSLLVASPWLLHNWRAYGDPTALNIFLEVQEQRPASPSLQDWLSEFGTLYRSFWGLFGGVNIAAPEIFYNAYNLLFVVGIAGAGFWLIFRRPEKQDQVTPPVTGEDVRGRHYNLPKGFWLLATWALIIFILLIRWNYFSRSFQGRLLFPALGAINIIWSAGLLSWSPSRYRGRLVLILAITTFVIAGLLPWTTIRPAYTYPKPVVSVPETSKFGPITFDTGDGDIQLVGVEVPENQIVGTEQDFVEVVLYWTDIDPVDKDYLSVVHLLGRDFQSVGYVNRYPAWGMVPTSRWQPGDIWRDEYHVFVSPNAQAPSKLRIKAGLYDPDSKRDVVAYGPDSNPIPLLVIGEAKLAPPMNAEFVPAYPLEVALEGGITFLGYDLEAGAIQPGDSVLLSLYWLANETQSKDWSVFVHLTDDDSQISGADSPPLSGDYPTSLWTANETIVDEHSLQIPATIQPGNYQIVLGLYEPSTLTRMGRLDGVGDTISLPIVVEGEG